MSVTTIIFTIIFILLICAVVLAIAEVITDYRVLRWISAFCIYLCSVLSVILELLKSLTC